MGISRWLLAACITVFLCSIPVAWAAPPVDAVDPPAAELKDETPEDNAEHIRQLVNELNDDKFAVRQAASRRLAEVGMAVIPSLAKAAQSEQLEVTTRCLDLLEGFLKSDDGETKTAAHEALTELAASQHEAAAGRASKILENQKTPPVTNLGQVLPNGRIQIMPGPGRIQIGGGNVQIQIGGAIGGKNVFKKVQMKNVNGVKTIDASDNEKTVKIVDDPNKGIHMEVTKKKGDKKETKTYDAKDEAELKKKHPEAHKIYNEYAANNGQVQIRGLQIIQGGQGQIQVLPLQKKQDDAKDADDADEESEKPADDSAEDSES